MSAELQTQQYSKSPKGVNSTKPQATSRANRGNVSLSSSLSPQSLEQDVKRLKADLQANRQLESELRSQLSSLSSQDRSLRSELGQLRQDNELLQNKWVQVHCPWGGLSTHLTPRPFLILSSHVYMISNLYSCDLNSRGLWLPLGTQSSISH